MTENKRYTLHQNGNYHTVIDEEENVPLIMIEFKENEFPVYACFHRIIDLLNEKEELIKRLKTIREEQTETILKQKRKMQELEERNQRQYKQLEKITDLMYKRDWERLEEMVNDWERWEKLLEQEWGTYCGDKE